LTIVASLPTFAARCGHIGKGLGALGICRVSGGLARSVAVSWARKYRTDPAHR
jgi:hypothetical protein